MLLEQAIDCLRSWAWFADLNNVSVQPTGRGTVNTTYFVNAATRQFVLKVYSPSTSTAQIQYEHALLAYLQHADLPFAVPIPLPIPTGETWVQVERSGQVMRMALLPLIAGNMLDRQNPQQVYAAGQALGNLHRALSKFDPDGHLAQLPAWGDLHHLHPLMPDPFDVLQLLELDSCQQQRLAKTLIDVLEASSTLYATLPMQATHADYLCPNLLVRENRVIGILDFEFATHDLRLMDFVGGLDHFGRFPWKDTSRREFVQAFCAGYGESIALTEAEIQALTTVWRLQRASCIVYWTGWMLDGKSTYHSVMRAVENTLLLEEWLQRHSTALLDQISQA